MHATTPQQVRRGGEHTRQGGGYKAALTSSYWCRLEEEEWDEFPSCLPSRTSPTTHPGWLLRNRVGRCVRVVSTGGSR